jgi:hypothetical protein
MERILCRQSGHENDHTILAWNKTQLRVHLVSIKHSIWLYVTVGDWVVFRPTISLNWAGGSGFLGSLTIQTSIFKESRLSTLSTEGNWESVSIIHHYYQCSGYGLQPEVVYSFPYIHILIYRPIEKDAYPLPAY